MKKWVGVVVVVLVVVAAIAVFLTLNTTGGRGSDFRAVSILMLEGPFKSYGDNVRIGINLAVEEIERKDGTKVAVNFKSFDGDPNKAFDMLKTAVTRDGFRFVVEIFGTAAALAVTDFVNENKVLTISGVDTGHLLTEKMRRYFFRIVPSDGEAVQALMNWATDLGVKRGAVVAVTTDWGKGVGDMVAYYAPRAGLTVSRQDVDKAHTVFAPQVAALKDARAEVVFLALNPDQAGNFVRAARAASYRPVILGTDNLTAGEFTSTAGSSAADVRYVLPPAAPGSAIRADVVRALRQKLRLPDSEEPHPFALYGYDTMWTLYRAMKAGKGNPERGAEFLESYRGEGATGPIQFTKAHDVVLAGSYRRMIIQKNASGKLAGVEVQ